MKIADLPPWPNMKRELTRSVSHKWPEMESWLHSFMSDDNDIKTLIRRTVALDPHDSYFLIQEVLRNCYKASTFREPEKDLRDTASQYLIDRRRARPAIKKLRDLAKQYPNYVGFEVARANAICSTRNPERHSRLSWISTSPAPLSLIFDEFMKALDESFQRDDVKGIRSGSYLHRYQSGTLLYSTPIDLHTSREDAALNGLIFSLAFHFRRATNGKQELPWNNGQPMPDVGEPRIPLIAQYAWLVFPNRREKITEDRIRDRLKHLIAKGATMSSWPK